MKFRSTLRQLTRAAEKGDLQRIKNLAVDAADMYTCYSAALIVASENGHLAVVEYLVELGANVHVENDAAIARAAEYGHLEIVKYLIAKGANARQCYALSNASRNGHLKIVRYLIVSGAYAHWLIDDALYASLRFSQLKIIKYLLAIHTKNKYFSSNGYTSAMLLGKPSYVKLHIKYGFTQSYIVPRCTITINMSKLIIRNTSITFSIHDTLADAPAVYKYYKPRKTTNKSRKLHWKYRPES